MASYMDYLKPQALADSFVGKSFDELMQSGFKNELGFEFVKNTADGSAAGGRVFFNHIGTDVTTGIELKINTEGIITGSAVIRW